VFENSQISRNPRWMQVIKNKNIKRTICEKAAIVSSFER
jgi:hypothetical protein